ncbi:secreted antigen 1 [Babesia divergens]|uniref:Secreted antigen 1 n=1 Tax=Babesia divergens TaxID=32595 RepID=A0AAD9G6Z4_BABDI|nr:secreted antigen 1 [Babesia divergens]
MKLVGILRVSVSCLLAIGLHGQYASGAFLSGILSFKKSSTANIAESSGNLKESTVESSSEPSVPVPVSGLVFQRPSWDYSHLASAFIFLEEFCRDVISKKFKEQVTNRVLYRDIKAVCRGCVLRLNFLSHYFVPTYGPGAVAGRKEIPKNFYKNVLKPEEFEVYVRWLAENIPEIKGSFKKMLAESLKYPSEQLKKDTTVGPLKYGFVFTGVRWNAVLPQWTNIDDDSALTLLVTLDKLRYFIRRALRSSGEELPVESRAVYNHEEPSVNSQAEIFMQFENAHNEDSSAPNDSDFEAQES